MTLTRASVVLLAAGVLASLLTACGSDSGSGSASNGSSVNPPAGTSAVADGGDDGGAVDGPCDVTDQATVASVFAGAGAGKQGQVRNCEYKIASGPVQAVNVFFYEDTTLDQYRKQLVDNGITFTPESVGDAALRDQVRTLVVAKGEVLFGVQALPRNGLTKADYAKYDPQTSALARKIAAKL